MADEEKIIPPVEEKLDLDNTKMYLDEIQRLKNSTVSIEEYKKLQQANKDLFIALRDGEKASSEASGAEVNVDELRKSLFTEDNTNLDFWTKALQLRTTLIEQGQQDPFLPVGHDVVPTQEDIDAANRVAEGVAECIKYADGDSNVFTNELQRITIDNVPVRRFGR